MVFRLATDLQVKKLKVDISATPQEKLGPYHHAQGREKLLIPPVKEKD